MKTELNKFMFLSIPIIHNSVTHLGNKARMSGIIHQSHQAPGSSRAQDPGDWCLWAFPQKGDHSMAAHHLRLQQKEIQVWKELIIPSQGLNLFCFQTHIYNTNVTFDKGNVLDISSTLTLRIKFWKPYRKKDRSPTKFPQLTLDNRSIFSLVYFYLLIGLFFLCLWHRE